MLIKIKLNKEEKIITERVKAIFFQNMPILCRTKQVHNYFVLVFEWQKSLNSLLVETRWETLRTFFFSMVPKLKLIGQPKLKDPAPIIY